MMNLEVTEYAGKKIVSVSGDIDMYSSPELREKLLNLVQSRVPVIVVDFKDVSYIDSSGIATFVEGLKGMKSYGGSLRLASISKGIMEIFNFAKLDRVFEIYSSIDDAVNV
jgi:anti-sigma B factor antagonist